MSLVVDLLPLTTITLYGGTFLGLDNVYVQPPESIVDLNGYSQASVAVIVLDNQVQNPGVTFGPPFLSLQTSEVNLHEHFTNLVYLVDVLDGTPCPYAKHTYLCKSDGGTGFGRYIRLCFWQPLPGSITLKIRALLKP